MNVAFWESRWSAGDIAFHQSTINPHLAQHVDWLGGARPAREACRVLVPLCGKSHDLLFLRQRGFEVVGVEFVEQAIREFFDECGLSFEPGPHSELPARHRAERLTLIQGDVLALDAASVGTFAAVYDRAALVALPDDGEDSSRRAYVKRIQNLAAPGCRQLLITLEYAAKAAALGPPFSVSQAWVRQHYAAHWRVECVHTMDISAESRLAKREGIAVLEHVFHLEHLV